MTYGRPIHVKYCYFLFNMLVNTVILRCLFSITMNARGILTWTDLLSLLSCDENDHEIPLITIMLLIILIVKIRIVSLLQL